MSETKFFLSDNVRGIKEPWVLPTKWWLQCFFLNPNWGFECFWLKYVYFKRRFFLCITRLKHNKRQKSIHELKIKHKFMVVANIITCVMFLFSLSTRNVSFFPSIKHCTMLLLGWEVLFFFLLFWAKPSWIILLLTSLL